ncbi:hypothetical protein [Flavobacterium sp.]|uniref:hypothetical protein n=1 Tax=Flavobacterium sp. TaxID=239 RepID=UPI0040335DB9
MIPTIATDTILDALLRCLADYQEALTIKSAMGMDLYLAKKHMFDGLCNYFVKNRGEFQEEIIYQIQKDSTLFRVEPFSIYLCQIPIKCTSIAEIHEEALKPRIAALEKTIARLQLQSQQ